MRRVPVYTLHNAERRAQVATLYPVQYGHHARLRQNVTLDTWLPAQRIEYLLSMSILKLKFKKALTCMLVLFLDEAEGVHRTCSFSVNLLTNIPTATHALTLNQYLLSASVISIILECSQTEVREQVSVPSISCHCPLPGRHPKHPLA